MSLDFYLETNVCEHCGRSDEAGSFNITHNLNNMAAEADVYECLWRPDEHGYDTAGQIIKPLQDGITLMESDPARFKKHNPENGWGDYDGFVKFCKQVLKSCESNPDATITISR